MWSIIYKNVTFKACTGLLYRHLPLKDTKDNITLQDTVQIDSIGPWAVTDKNGVDCILYAITIINIAIGLIKIFQVLD